jgi:hypothetical protein
LNEALIGALEHLRDDPSAALALYEQLYEARLFALVSDGMTTVPDIMFITYPSLDGVRELPVFTSDRVPLLSKLQQESGATPIAIDGPILWRRLLDIVQTGECEIAVDANEDYGIRLNREMVLSMVSAFGSFRPE